MIGDSLKSAWKSEQERKRKGSLDNFEQTMWQLELLSEQNELSKVLIKFANHVLQNQFYLIANILGLLNRFS